MTAYRNFVQDFPLRCLDILASYERHARLSDREVTLSLAIASAALVVPFERLRPSAADHIAPDRSKPLVKQLGRILGLPFSDWAGQGWYEHSISASRVRGRTVEDWLPDGSLQPIGPDRKVDSVLTVIRNALSHGNIFTSASANRQISQLVFLSKPRDSDEFSIVAASPREFVRFLHKWVECLSQLRLPEEPVQSAHHGGLARLIGMDASDGASA